jgi:hypothetical protein
MSSVVIAGDVSGTCTLQAANAAGTTVLTLPTTSGTLVTTNGSPTFTTINATNVIASANSNAAVFTSGLGNASAPAYSFTGDTNTGIFSPTADTIAFSEGGAEAMRIDSSGNVGIGNTDPSSFFSEARNLVVGSGSGGQGITIFAGTASQSRLMFADGTSGDASYTGFVQYDHSSNSLAFGTNGGNERMRITSAGTVLLGTTSTSSFDGGFRAVPTGSGNSMQVIISNTGGGLPVLLNRSDDGNIIDFRRAGTNVGAISVTTTNTAYNTSSDYRLKENIAPMTGALAKITQLKPVTYTWKSTGKTSQGFIAHELQAVVPDCVTGEKDAVDEEGNPVHQGVDTSYLVATLTSAIQELKAVVDAQAAEIAALKTKVGA